MNRISKIIIIGTNHHNALSMVRCFGEEGLKVVLYIYGAQRSFIASSIYVEHTSFFTSASDAIDAAYSFACKFTEKTLIIACSDEVASLMDNRYDEFVKKCYFFNAGEAGRVTTYMDKQIQLELAKECGFSVPSSIDTLTYNANLEIVKFPCIIKPEASIHGGKNITICRTKKELKTALTKYNPNYNVLIQDYIQKEYEVVVLGLSIGETIIIPGYIQKHREERGGTTYSTVKPIKDLPQFVVDASKRMINVIGYQGLWGIECIKQGNDYFFLELNMRNDATTYSMKSAGVNLPYLYLQMIEYPGIYADIKNVRTINSIVEFNDFNFVLKGKVSLIKWLREFKDAECKYFMSSVDPVPYKLMKKEYIKFLLKRLFKF